MARAIYIAKPKNFESWLYKGVGYWVGGLIHQVPFEQQPTTVYSPASKIHTLYMQNSLRP